MDHVERLGTCPHHGNIILIGIDGGLIKYHGLSFP